MDELNKKFPCRENQITQLKQLYGHPNEPVPGNVFVYGESAVGKTTILLDFFKLIKIKIAYINCIECYTTRLLLEPLLVQLLETNEEVKCENFMDFVYQLQIADVQGYFANSLQIILIDGVEYLQSMNEQYFSAFSRLQELTDIFSLSVIFISNIIPEKFNTDSSFITIHFPQYSKSELLTLLKANKPENCTVQFYENYLNAAMSVFLRTTRDLNEMRNLILSNFEKYCEPIVRGELKDNDIAGLWRNIAPHLKESLNTAYLGFNLQNSKELLQSKDVELITNKTMATFDLPYYAKYLLIAGYLASYNSPKHDKRLYLKCNGKTKKRVSKKIVKEKLASELLGPKAFSLDRLLAIFYAIMEEKASLTVNLMSQIASLVELRLLAKIGDGCLDKPKYKCLVGLQCVELVARTLSFQIKKYLIN